jgi:5-dehydro-4-deoxyglucarate dehydratase
MHAYYANVAAASRRGVIIYSRDFANFSPAAVERLTSIPNLIAFKDGQGDIRKYEQIVARVGDKLHWIGGAGDDLVPDTIRWASAPTRAASRTSPRDFLSPCTEPRRAATGPRSID